METKELINAPDEIQFRLDDFTARLNTVPHPSKVRQDPKGFNYIPASYIEMDLDEIFLGLWAWEVKSIQVVANEILVHGDLRVFHPVLKQWVTRSGVGAAMIRQTSGAMVTDINAKIKDAISMDLPHAETDALKNAAKKFGQAFGRDLNRKFVDNYESPFMEEVAIDPKKLQDQINKCKDIAALKKLYSADDRYTQYAELFATRKNELAAEKKAK